MKTHGPMLPRAAVLLVSLLGMACPTPNALAETGELRLPAIFGDNMVIQQDQPIPIWGWTKPGATVAISFAGEQIETRASPSGSWKVHLNKLKANHRPQSLSITSVESRVFTNILVGEVWLASGQSNMEKPIGQQPGQQPCVDAEVEIAAANFSQIRLFKVEKGSMSRQPLQDLKSYHAWRECSSRAMGETSFSAAAYFFARSIHTNLAVPVGIIASCWGGTRIEPWTPPAGFEGVSSVAEFGRPQERSNEIIAARSSEIYNTMIHPLVPFAIRGALWYQGESNCLIETNRAIYADKMEALIHGWRSVWRQGTFPFYYVQLAPYQYSARKQTPPISPNAPPEMWQAQIKAMRIENTGMAVIHDTVTDLADIHPVRKREVGERLARIALHHTYGRREICPSGPMVEQVRYDGPDVRVRFRGCNGTLRTRDGRPPDFFEVADASGSFVEARARIEGNEVVCSSPLVPRPSMVRFGWSEVARPNLVNGADLPAFPF